MKNIYPTAKTSTFVNRKKIIDTRDRHFGMVVDGQCLAVALKQHRDRFSQIARQCEAVVCCRMSPIQKAEVSSHSIHMLLTSLIACYFLFKGSKIS